MRILCEVFGLFDKRGASEGGTHYIIRGAWGLGAYKGAAERRLTGGRKYAPKGNGKDEKEKKKACKRKKKERKGEKKPKRGSLTGGRKYAPKGNGKDEKEKKRACKRKKKERKGRKRWEGERQKEKKACKRRKKKKKKEKKRNGNGTKMRKEGRMTRPSLFQNVNSLVVHSSSELRSTLKSPLLSAFLLNSRPL